MNYQNIQYSQYYNQLCANPGELELQLFYKDVGRF